MRCGVQTLKETDKVYVKCTLRREPANIFLELKERGIVGSVREQWSRGSSPQRKSEPR